MSCPHRRQHRLKLRHQHATGWGIFKWVRRETGKELMVEVHYEEGVATRLGLESCVGRCEAPHEALTEERTGQPWSHDRNCILGADAVHLAEGNTTGRASASVPSARRGRRTWHVRTLFEREPGDLSSGQPLYWAGPQREGEEP